MVEYFEIGQIVNTRGLKGVIKVNPFTDDMTRFSKLKKVLVEYKKELVEFEIEEASYQKNQVYLKLKGIDTIEQALQYKECYLKIHRKDAISLPKDTYFIADLLGLEVYNKEGNRIGILEDIYNTGANDIYVVKDNLGKQMLLPAIPDVIQKIDLENNKIMVDIIEGLV